MLSVLIRIAALVVAMSVLVDTFLPSTFEAVQVDRHITRDNTSTDRYGNHTQDITYEVQFSGDKADSCAVGYSTYNLLHDGDSVTVQTSRLFRKCIAIDRNDQAVYRATYWRFGSAAFAFFLLAVGFGWLQWYDDDDRRGGWFFRSR